MEQPTSTRTDPPELVRQAYACMRRRPPDYHTALARLDEALSLRPGDAETHLAKAICMLALDRPKTCGELLEAAAAHDDGALAPRLRLAHLELARVLLRRHAFDEAIGALDGAGNDALSRSARAYTRLRLGGAPHLTGAEHERVVRWLTRRELDAAERAVRERRYTDALQACDAASRVDDRGSRLALLRATALRRRVEDALDDGSAQLRKMHNHLTAARGWLHRAAEDPAECAAEARAIEELDGRVAEQFRRAEVQTLRSRFEATCRIHNEARMTFVEYGVFRSSVAGLHSAAEQLQRSLPQHSDAHDALADLLAEIRQMQLRFR
ncbi:tetratricopeptide repeat protein [Dactylosporangium darangshiense]|uniref:Tetratricopeptide repeat protein n=1 Tax=Dactylosporangium darangshiense TaxID=579108 RepID=A0ABP8CYR2_9ACTN